MTSLHSTKTITLLVITLLLSGPMMGSQHNEAEGRHTLTIANGSSRDIHRLQMSPSGTGSWRPDLLGRAILRSGESRSWGDIGSGEYDILFIDARENQCVRKNVMIFNDISLRITDQCF